MMAEVEIIRYETEMLPERKLIGKRFSEADRDENGGFAGQWKKWFENSCCASLMPLRLNPASDDILGFMRTVQGNFEYWIGHFCRPDAVAPAGYSELALPAAKVAVVYLRGAAGDPAIYGMHDACLAYLARHGFKLAETPFFFERYNCPRFTVPDTDGNIMLDYAVAVL